eukprot:scaffold222431_cov20-Tisochrysis_lutea.AAC.4
MEPKGSGVLKEERKGSGVLKGEDARECRVCLSADDQVSWLAGEGKHLFTFSFPHSDLAHCLLTFALWFPFVSTFRPQERSSLVHT